MGFLKFFSNLRSAIRLLIGFIGVIIWVITFGLIAIIQIINEIGYRHTYGAMWKQKYESIYGQGSLAQNEKMASIGGFSSLAIILLFIWFYRQTFFKNKNYRKSEHHRRKHR